MKQDPTEQYLLGILSLLPAMLGVTMENVATALPLRSEVRQALLGLKNVQRTILSWLESYESGEWEGCDASALPVNLPAPALPEMYAEALLWADTNMTLTD